MFLQDEFALSLTQDQASYVEPGVRAEGGMDSERDREVPQSGDSGAGIFAGGAAEVAGV